MPIDIYILTISFVSYLLQFCLFPWTTRISCLPGTPHNMEFIIIRRKARACKRTKIIIYIYIYNLRKNPRDRSVRLESSMSTAIDCIILLGLKMHKKSRAKQKHFNMKIKRKKITSLVSLQIYFRSMMTLFRWCQKTTVQYLDIIWVCLYCFWQEENSI